MKSLLNLTNEVKKENSTRNPSKRLIPFVNSTYKFFIYDHDAFVKVPVHYVKTKSGGAYIKHIENCPVCEKNDKLVEEYPDSYRDKFEFSPLSFRVAILVYDITEYRYCGNCGSENRISESKCWKCGKSLASSPPEPANAFKALVLSSAQSSQLAGTLRDFVSETGAKFKEFYTKLSVTKSDGGRKILNFTHFISKETPKGIDSIEEFSEDILEKYAVIELNREEIIEFRSGASLRDILKARNIDRDEDVEKNNNTEDSNNEEIKKIVEDLFGE